MNATHREDRIIATNPPSLPSPQQLLELIEQSLDDDKAIDIVSIDLTGKSSIADAMVVASGASVRQVGAMADHLREKLKAAGIKGISIEGLENCDWVLIDSGDVIVHLFRPEVRDFYNLEKLWSEALPESVDVTAAQN
ncbi:MAG: ribosome silencing factor [Pseudomonadota bacterium]|nr:ribosome silencing factor [Rhodospirillaceae bacterium]MEC8164043.1 ribosome silencing factor [Pseudomonadota bacterium]MED5357991.1 ribosome silencing factor [Pseudomonadota bacterium]